MSEPSRDVARQEASLSTRFMNKVVAEFSGDVGAVALTKFQSRLAQNYFMAINASLNKAEIKRQKKNANRNTKERDKENLPVTWANVNMGKLAQDVVACARIGLDPAQRNHIAMTPFKNSSTNQYDIVFIEGYRGVELKASKYGLDVPEAVIVELVYSNDKFKSFKKSKDNQVESYSFEIVNDFDRGEIIGGFYYHAHKDPARNKLIVMTLKDILKRKPRYASSEFWGGEKDVWENGQKVRTEQVDGWYEKMCFKTVYRAAYGDITIDSQKIDDDFLRLQANEDRVAEAAAEAEINEHANQQVVDAEWKEPDDTAPNVEAPPADATTQQNDPTSGNGAGVAMEF